MPSPSQRDRMQLLAQTSTQNLYWDAAETESFYLYDSVAGTLIPQTSAAAKTWYDSTATTQFPGLNFWGYFGQPGHVQGRSI